MLAYESSSPVVLIDVVCSGLAFNFCFQLMHAVLINVFLFKFGPAPILEMTIAVFHTFFLPRPHSLPCECTTEVVGVTLASPLCLARHQSFWLFWVPRLGRLSDLVRHDYFFPGIHTRVLSGLIWSFAPGKEHEDFYVSLQRHSIHIATYPIGLEGLKQMWNQALSEENLTSAFCAFKIGSMSAALYVSLPSSLLGRTKFASEITILAIVPTSLTFHD